MKAATGNELAALDRIAARSTIRVVDYGHEYLEGTLQVAREVHARSLYRDMPLDEAKVIRELSAASWGMAPGRYFRLAVRDADVLGGFHGCAFVTFFSNEITARDMGWWVRESARGGAAAVLLLADFERWARERGARKCTVGQSGVEDIDRTRKLYQHCGYTITGYNAAKEIEHV
jgi:GNAT superfamily N-acetyltransferase